MHKRAIWCVCLLTLLWMAAGTPLRAQDHGKPPVYTYLAEWAVPRAQWADMTKVDEDERPLMDKLVADGTIIGHGAWTNLIHQEGEPTHGTWFTASSEGNLMKALEALYARPTLTAPVLAASKHWDYIMVSRTYNGRSGKFEGGYLSGGGDVKPGHEREYQELGNAVFVPVLEKLLADGAITSYTVASEDYHTHKPGRVTFVLTTPDAAALDKVDQAFEPLFEKNLSLGPALGSMTDAETQRDFLARVRYMTNK